MQVQVELMLETAEVMVVLQILARILVVVAQVATQVMVVLRALQVAHQDLATLVPAVAAVEVALIMQQLGAA
jgi:hypothetical protein